MTSLPSITDELVRNAGSLRALARDLLGDPGLADDAVQQACVTALVRPPGSRHDVPAWLRAVVRTCALDLRRAEHRRLVREQRTVRSEEAEGGDRTPVDMALRIELQQDILAAVRALAEPYRTTVWLRYYEHLPPTGIAARIGQPVATVKMRLWRALQLLRQRLDSRYGGRGWLATLAPLVRGPATTSGLGAGLAAGALFMQGKKIAIAVAVVLLVLGGATLGWPSGETAPGSSAAPSLVTANEPRPVSSDAVATVPERHEVANAAPVAAAATSPYGDLVVHVRWHDGTPAPDVAIVCQAEAEPQLDLNEARVVSDQDGIARAAHLRAGEVQLTSDRGGKATARVESGGASTTEFVLPRGVDVTGTVTDERERPVGGARIFLASGKTGWLGGRTVATSAADGSFTVRSADARWSIGALGKGHAPSELVDLGGIERPGDTALVPDGSTSVQVQLRLLRPGATVVGRVTDDRGEPVAGACVAIGWSRLAEWQVTAQSGSLAVGDRRREFWSPDVVTTDEHGAFRCDGVEPGNQPIDVRAAGHGIWSNEIECAAGETRMLAVTLPRGVTVQGIARNAAGEAVAGAVIAALDNPSDWQFHGSQKPQVRAFAWPETRSDGAGHFELQGVLPGVLHLFACKRTEPGRPHQGMCREPLAAAAGDTVTWNPVLQFGKNIRVRVLDADGEHGMPNALPIGAVSLSIEATAERAAPGAELLFGLLVDETAGTFVVNDCAEVPYTVAVQIRRHGKSVHAWQGGVLPDGPEIVLRLPPPPPKGDAIVRGRVVDSGRRVPAGKQVVVRLAANGTERRAACSDDRFEFTDVEPGSYVLLLQVDEVRVLSAPFSVKSGEVLDVGDLVTEPAASITVRLQAPAGIDLAKARGTLGHGPASRSLTWNGRALHADNVSAGKHRLMFWSTGWLARPRDVDLIAGQDNEIVVDVIAATPRAMEITFPFPDQWRLGNLRVRDQTGEVVAERIGTLSAAIGLRALPWKPSLPAGRFTLEAATDTGLLRSWPVDCTDLPTSEMVLRFSMR